MKCMLMIVSHCPLVIVNHLCSLDGQNSITMTRLFLDLFQQKRQDDKIQGTFRQPTCIFKI